MKVEVTHLYYWGGNEISVVTAYGDRSHVLDVFMQTSRNSLSSREAVMTWAAKFGHEIVASYEDALLAHDRAKIDSALTT